MLSTLRNKRIILASRSPRRQHLLEGLDIPFEVIPPASDNEQYPPDMDPMEVPLYLARMKAGQFRPVPDDKTLIITADTIVLCDSTIVEKPGDMEDAYKMLSKLANNHHTVITGVCLKSGRKEKCFSATTEVFFGDITGEEIGYYIKKYDPLDKAGAYGIQEWIGYTGVKRIEGSFFNVMGLPVHMLYEELKRF